MDSIVSVISLVIAVLAVVVGPIVSSRIATHQIGSSLKIANKQITAPMRQAWINSLRELLAEFNSKSLHYFVAGIDDRTDEDYERLEYLVHKIQLMLNSKEEDHRRLEELVRNINFAHDMSRDGDKMFQETHTEITELTRKILKREWNRVKEEFPS